MEKEIIEMLQDKGWFGALIGLIIITMLKIFKSKYFIEIWSKLTDKFIEFFLKKKVKERENVECCFIDEKGIAKTPRKIFS